MKHEFLTMVLNDIKRNAELSWFFKHLWVPDLTLAKLFFAHRAQLFPTEGSVSLPLLFWDNLEADQLQPSDIAVVKTAAELGAIKSNQWYTMIQKIFKNLFGAFKDLVLYFLIEFIRRNEQLCKLVESEKFSFRIMKETLTNYETLDLELFDQFQEKGSKFKELADFEIDDPIAKSKLKQVAETIEDSFLGNVSEIVPGFVRVLSDYATLLAPVYYGWHKHLVQLRKTQDVSPEEYTRILSNLYTLDLVQNISTFVWCRSCRDSPQIYQSASQISPDHLKMACLNCEREMDIGSIFRLHETIPNCILSQDGLLCIAVAWLLDKREIAYKYAQKGTSEYDFICTIPKGTVLIECKMFRTDREEPAVVTNLEQGIIQMVRHVEELRTEGMDIVGMHLFCNYESDILLNAVETLKQKPKSGKRIQDYNIVITSYADIPDLLKAFK